MDAEEGLDSPEDIASAIEGHLRAALEEIGALIEELDVSQAGLRPEVPVAEAAE